MNTPLLKVCGLTKLDQIQELISMNTDFLGFIFYEKSPRYVLNHLSLDDISKINHQGKVGVFVNEEINTILEIAQKAKLNFIQLHGDESENFISELKGKLNPETGIIKVIRIGPNSVLSKDEDSIQNDITYLLFDTDSKTFGGTGKQFDWALLNEFKIRLPYFLSGGISEDNVTNIKNLNQPPFALDINSKFELEAGIKDVEKIKKFKTLYG
ncbi:phosphoribosylanthranilate isomerase [Chryseobacterium sp. ERMR1:04]|uniref:phosphoribosylanthranilate isomerase n=1 Tax=Chryseobacterium sp. ERMR1:04 TaxID=1705393 RepID=UPI0006C83C20|nr:phosphoribosylanthranilate isomerase [Chryseobacterium sp. ERMR1:04]KPH13013.1 phosphoribosylanthranilate isomerase [Chryseobacterium sp. ERMR1:04]